LFFETNDNYPKLKNIYEDLLNSNRSLAKKFKNLEDTLSKGHFLGGHKKLPQWKDPNGNKTGINYIGSGGDGPRIYYKFVQGEFTVTILAYSDKNTQRTVNNRMLNLYANNNIGTTNLENKNSSN